jgi:hypothetical protein
MAKNVIIFGAGASNQFGAPVMRDFLDVARKLYSNGGLRVADGRSFENVFAAISRLQVVHSKSSFDLVNLESLFTAFELAITLRKFPGIAPRVIKTLVNDLKTVIVSTLEATIDFSLINKSIKAPPTLIKFINSITKGGAKDIALLTFNYDLLIDVALMNAGRTIDYGLAVEPGGPPSDTIPLLKLHGSLNWTTDEDSKKVLPWFLRHYINCYDLKPLGKTRKFRITIGENLSEMGNKHKTEGNVFRTDGQPVIVPPSWNKADSHRAISDVWARAAKELSDASSIFVVGYSLPETDSFFKQLYALGTIGDTLLERFWVFNRDKERESVFSGMLGPGAHSRFKYHSIDFKDSMKIIDDAINDGLR